MKNWRLFLLLTLVTGGILTFAKPIFAADSVQKEVKIRYINAQTIVDPEFLISIPSELVFTKNEKRIDTSVSMFNLDGKNYDGQASAEIKILSKNNYFLRNADDFEEIKYYLRKMNADNSATTLTNFSPSDVLGTLSKTTPKIKSEGVLGSTGISKDKVKEYEDVLTYTVTVTK